jgi:hypothetical protein
MSYNPNNPNGSTTSANSAPVVIADGIQHFSVELDSGSGFTIVYII